MAQETGNSLKIETWASDGDVVEPGQALIDLGWEEGQRPPHEHMNWLHNLFGQKINHILQHGAPRWNGTTTYGAGDIVTYDGQLWLALSGNTGSTPAGGNANWDAFITDGSLDVEGVPETREINTGPGLAGGGDLAQDRLIELSAGTKSSLALADTSLQPEDVGTIASQDANDVNINGVFDDLDGANLTTSQRVWSGSTGDWAGAVGSTILGNLGITSTSSSLVVVVDDDPRMVGSKDALTWLNPNGTVRRKIDSDGMEWRSPDASNPYVLGPGSQGTFTPAFDGGAVTYTAQQGRYQIIGNRLHFSLYIAWSDASSSAPSITGLPYPPALDNEGLSVGYTGRDYTVNDPGQLEALTQSGTVGVKHNFGNGGSSGDGSTVTLEDGEAGQLRIAGSYEIDTTAL